MTFDLFFVLGALVLAYVLYVSITISYRARIALRLIAESTPFSRAQGSRSILDLGDSTAASVGCASEFSVPGRFADLIDASVDNVAKSGAKTIDLAGQLSSAPKEKYDLVLVQIGVNDVIYMHSLSKAQKNLESVIESLRRRSNRILVLTAGHIEDAPIFPWPLNTILYRRTINLRQRFIASTASRGAIYVDIYPHPNSFHAEPAKYFAADGFHLTAEGYGFWFGIVKTYVEKNWPELIKNQ